VSVGIFVVTSTVVQLPPFILAEKFIEEIEFTLQNSSIGVVADTVSSVDVADSVTPSHTVHLTTTAPPTIIILNPI